MFLTALATALLTAASPAKSSQKTTPAPVVVAPTVPVQEPDSLFYKMSVSKGQTLSWIGLRQLGAWTLDISAQVVADNPGLKPDALVEGQSLRLRRSLDRRTLPPIQQIAMASRKAVVTRTQGRVDVVLADGTTKPLTANQFLSVGDRIRTGAGGVAELVIDNQSILRVRENSQLSIAFLQDSAKFGHGKAGTQVSLELGSVWSKVRKWAGPLVGFEVRLPNAIAGVHGTIFECVVRADSTGDVKVYEGVVGVTGRGQAEIKVTRGQQVSVGTTGSVTSPTLSPAEKIEPAWDPSEESRRTIQEDMRQAELRTSISHAGSVQALPNARE